jgi:plasmid stability protein
MADLLVRNVPEDVVAKLKERAQVNGRSLNAETNRVLADSVRDTWDEWLAKLDEFTATLTPIDVDLTALLNEERDARTRRILGIYNEEDE